MESECTICLDKHNGEFKFLDCDHKFHEECIEKQKNCPLCGNEAKSTPEDPAFRALEMPQSDVVMPPQQSRFCNESVIIRLAVGLGIVCVIATLTIRFLAKNDD